MYGKLGDTIVTVTGGVNHCIDPGSGNNMVNITGGSDVTVVFRKNQLQTL